MMVKAKRVLARLVHVGGVTLFMLSVCRADTDEGCFIERQDNRLVLGNDGFRWQLDLADGVRVDSVENRLTGARIDLGKGSECGLRFSATLNRIELLDWKQTAGGNANEAPDSEKGYHDGFYEPDFDDSAWQKTESPWVLSYGPGGVPPLPNPQGYNWFRVTFDLPDAAGEPVTFGLGGSGIYDFGQQRFFINGEFFGQRVVEKDQWQDPSILTLSPEDPAYQALRFGQKNTLAVQASSRTRCRPQRLEDLDPTRHWDMARILMMQDQFVTVGPAYQDVQVTGITKVDVLTDSPEQGHVQITLKTGPNYGRLLLNYEWTADEPALRKWLEFTNTSGKELLLLDVDLGDYPLAVDCTEGFRGHPVHVDGEVFMSIAHPAGVAQGSQGRVRLRHFPGKYLKANERFLSKQAVYGMAKSAGKAQEAFWDYLLRRSMRRQIEGIASSLHYDGLSAAWGRPSPWGQVDPPSERVCLSIMDRMEQLQNDYGLKFDIFWLDAGWWEYEKRQEMIEFSYAGFPDGPAKTIDRAKELGMRFGIWTSRGSGDCTIDHRSHDTYMKAITHHIENNGVTGFKFDGQQPRCWRKDHAQQRLHLPGKYSTEPFQDSNIEIYQHARDLCPEVWIYGYWGHDSPWWLTHVCTTFDHGANAEMQSPARYPALYDRDRKMLAMDQLEQFRDDMPPPGRNSLGVWTGEGWAKFGHQRWRENLLIDVCRGPAIFHLWSDIRKFNEADYALMDRVRKAMKSHPECFQNSQIIIGDPWKNEPYGYTCSDGHRAYLAAYNPLFTDQRIDLTLDEGLGLTSNEPVSIYRYYPQPARMISQPADLGTRRDVDVPANATVNPQRKTLWRNGESLTYYLRPTEVVFLEVAPAKEGSALGEDDWQEMQLPERPYQPAAQEISRMIRRETDSNVLQIKGRLPIRQVESTLLLLIQGTQDGEETDVHRSSFRLDGNVGKLGIGSFVQDPDGAEIMTTLDQVDQVEKDAKGYSFFPQASYGKWFVLKVPLPPADMPADLNLYLTENVPGSVSVQYRLFFTPMVFEENADH